MSDDDNAQSTNFEPVCEFCKCTGSSKEVARQFLNATDWQLDSALSAYFDKKEASEAKMEGTEDQPDRREQEPEARGEQAAAGDAPIVTRSVISEALQEEPMEDDTIIIVSDSDEEEVLMSAPENDNGDTITFLPPRIGGLRLVTLDSLRGESFTTNDGQTFYAGGSEHSGQEVLGPSRRIDHEDLINNVFRSVRELGGTELPAPPAVSGRRLRTFEGIGYRLGQSATETEVIGTVPVPSVPSQSQSDAPDTSERRELCIRMWREGFTINSGRLRLYSDVSERELLAQLGHGHVPPELLPEGSTSTQVHLSIEDHRHDSHRPVKKRKELFTGPGYVLGSVAPNVRQDTASSDEGEPPQKQAAQSSSEESAPDDVRIDETRPTTTVLIRFPDGARLPITLNISHTIYDLRRMIVIHHPELRSRQFSLVHGFPPSELPDRSLTLEMAGVLNSTLLIKFLD